MREHHGLDTDVVGNRIIADTIATAVVLYVDQELNSEYTP
jgi:hypothetical protein